MDGKEQETRWRNLALILLRITSAEAAWGADERSRVSPHCALLQT